MEEGFLHIRNYRQVTPSLATSGQPSEQDLRIIANAGYQTVINLALHDDPRYSLPDEPSAVTALGMKYEHIPVHFNNPTETDLAAFFKALDEHRNDKLWIHCAANFRVSAFLGLYRVIRDGWKHEQAFELMQGVWQPNDVWAAFIAERLASANAEPQRQSEAT